MSRKRQGQKKQTTAAAANVAPIKKSAYSKMYLVGEQDYHRLARASSRHQRPPTTATTKARSMVATPKQKKKKKTGVSRGGVDRKLLHDSLQHVSQKHKRQATTAAIAAAALQPRLRTYDVSRRGVSVLTGARTRQA